MIKPHIFTCIFFIAFLFFDYGLIAQTRVDVWLTNYDRSALFQQQPNALNFTSNKTSNQTIIVDDSKTYQRMDGFGFALTGGSAQHIINMNASARNNLLHQLFDTTGNAIGISYLRLSIASSDLNEKVFSYDDVAGDNHFAAEFFDT